MNKREVGIEIQTQIIRHGELEQFGIGHQKKFAQIIPENKDFVTEPLF
jgi:hypothetical protein